MPSKTSELVQSIVALQEMRTRQDAQKLAREMSKFQQQAIQAGTFQTYQNIGQGMTDPTQMAQYAQNLSPTGNADALAQIFQGTAPSVATTEGAAVAAGRNSGKDPNLDLSAAQQKLTGTHDTPQTLLGDQLTNMAHAHLDQLPPEQQHFMAAQVLQGLATHQTLTEAMLDEVFTKLPPEDKKLALKVKQHITLSPDEQAQLTLGYTNARIQDRAVTSQSAYQAAQSQAAMAEITARYGHQRGEQINQLVMKKDELQQKLMSGSATLTEDGVRQTASTINAYNNLLRISAPEIFGPQGTSPLKDMPVDGTIGATGILPALGQSIKQKVKQ